LLPRSIPNIDINSQQLSVVDVAVCAVWRQSIARGFYNGFLLIAEECFVVLECCVKWLLNREPDEAAAKNAVLKADGKHVTLYQMSAQVRTDGSD
jgi:hypothetical protein